MEHLRVDTKRSAVRALLAQTAVANLGDGILLVFFPLAAVSLTDSPGLIAAVTAAAMAPWFLFVIPFSLIIDRRSRRQVMLSANVFRAVAMLTLAAIVSGISPVSTSLPLLIGAALTLGAAQVLADTASQTIVPSYTATDDLEEVNGRVASLQVVGQSLVGPAAGGALAGFDLKALPWAIAGSFLIAAIACHRLPIDEHIAPTNRIVPSDAVKGIVFLARHRGLRSLAGMVAALNLGFSGMIAVLAVYAVDPGPMDLSPSGFGYLLAVVGAGGTLGGFLVGNLVRSASRLRVVTAAGLCLAAAPVVPALTANVVLVGIALAVAGAAVPAIASVLVSARQRLTPPELLGRVNGAYQMIGIGMAPVGALLAGAIAEGFTIQASFLVAALLALTGLLTMVGGAAPLLRSSGAPGNVGAV